MSDSSPRSLNPQPLSSQPPDSRHRDAGSQHPMEAVGATDLELDRIARETFVRSVEYHETIDSTNSRAMALSERVGLELPLLVIANDQTRGRGRGSNTWWSRAGSLTFSLLVRPSADVPKDRWPLAALLTGLSVRDAVDSLCPHSIVTIKWPNDIYLADRKVGGILVEVPSQVSGQMVIGIGVNVNNDFAGAPEEIRTKAIAIRDTVPVKVTRGEVLARILLHFHRRWNALAGDSLDLSAEWSHHCLLTGRFVQLRAGTRESGGTCLGIDKSGALLLRTARGIERFVSGVVTSSVPAG